MDLDKIKERLDSSTSIYTSLGMELVSSEEEDICMARMRVYEQNRQPFGYLSGGASLAMAETLAGAGSYALCPDCVSLGVNVSGTHVKAVKEGEIVTAVARIIHKGSKVHNWQVFLKDSSDDIVANIQVTNYIIHK